MMNNHSNKDEQKENEKSLESKLEHMGICDINDRDFNIAVLKVLIKM